jgi:LDH2 family malate/lactate/ureidoglycolate dehydrogenase
LMVEMLTGVLPGAAVGPNPESLRPDAVQPDEGIGHFFLVVNPEFFTGLTGFVSSADAMLSVVDSCPPAQWADRVRHPGQPEANAVVAGLRDGVRLPNHVLDALSRLADEHGVEFWSADDATSNHNDQSGGGDQ